MRLLRWIKGAAGETMARVGRRGFAAGPIAVLGVVLASACSGGTPRSPFIGPNDATVRIEVTNNNFQDATLHAVWTGQRRRLGIVTGKTEATYILPWPTSRQLRIEIDLLAGPGCTTRPIMTDPGDILLLEIRSRLLDDPDCVR